MSSTLGRSWRTPKRISGGALWQPMAILMMSGLALASVLTLVFVPAGYFLLFRIEENALRPERAADDRYRDNDAFAS